MTVRCLGQLLFGFLVMNSSMNVHAAGELMDFNIPAQTLDQALGDLARKTGLKLLVEPGTETDRSMPAVRGRLSGDEALRQLLAGSGLESVEKGEAIVVRQAATSRLLLAQSDKPLAQATPEQAAEERASTDKAAADKAEVDKTAPAALPTVTVTAEGDVVKDQVATRSTTATKSDTPIIETPQSISVITRDELDTRAATTVVEALRYTPGVMAEGFGFDSRGYDWMFMRGFDALTTNDYRDGLRQFGNNSFAFFRTEAYGLERVEVLRGPSSVTYGQGDAGGIINRVSKLPTAQAIREVNFQYGNFDRKQGSVDFGGALNSDGSVLFRLVGLGMDTDTQDRYTSKRRVTNTRMYIAPSITFLSGNTSYTLMGDVFANWTDGFSFADTVNGRPSRLLTGEPNFNKLTQHQWSIGHKFEHRFDSGLILRQNLRHSKVNIDFNRVIDYDLIGNELQRAANIYKESVEQTAIDTQLHGKYTLGVTDHNLMLGVDWLHADTSERILGDMFTFGVPVSSLDRLNPVYGQPFARPADLVNNVTQKLDQVGVYIQDQIKIDKRLILTLSGRHDWAMMDTNDKLFQNLTKRTDTAFTGRAGMTYLLGWGLAPYFSYAQSFLPLAGADVNGRPFDPTRGEQYEFGLKYQPEGTRALFTLAFFNLTKNNVLTADFNMQSPTFRQTGEVRSRGVELEGKMSLAKGLDLVSSYTYTDIKVIKSDYAAEVGKRPIIIPKHMASGWLNYTLPEGFFRGLGFGVGVRYIGPRFNDAENTSLARSYFLTDAAVFYQRGPVRLAINGSNLFDKEYVGNCSFGACYRGAERIVLGSVRLRW